MAGDELKAGIGRKSEDYVYEGGGTPGFEVPQIKKAAGKRD